MAAAMQTVVENVWPGDLNRNFGDEFGVWFGGSIGDYWVHAWDRPSKYMTPVVLTQEQKEAIQSKFPTGKTHDIEL